MPLRAHDFSLILQTIVADHMVFLLSIKIYSFGLDSLDCRHSLRLVALLSLGKVDQFMDIVLIDTTSSLPRNRYLFCVVLDVSAVKYRGLAGR